MLAKSKALALAKYAHGTHEGFSDPHQVSRFQVVSCESLYSFHCKMMSGIYIPNFMRTPPYSNVKQAVKRVSRSLPKQTHTNPFPSLTIINIAETNQRHTPILKYFANQTL